MFQSNVSRFLLAPHNWTSPLLLWRSRSLTIEFSDLHLTHRSNSPLSADFTQANVYDNQIYPAITSSLPQGVRYVAADLGYDDYKLYNLSIDRGFELVYPTPPFKWQTAIDKFLWFGNKHQNNIRQIHIGTFFYDGLSVAVKV